MNDDLRATLRRVLDVVHVVRRHKGGSATVVLATWLLGALGLAAGRPALEPLLLVAPLFPLLLLDLMAGDLRRAGVRLASWCGAVLSLAYLAQSVSPDTLAAVAIDAPFWNGEMTTFLRTGEGLLARPEDFGTDHVLHYLYVSVGSALGAGLAPLLLASRQLLLDGALWAHLTTEATPAWRGLLGGLPPWTVAGYAGHALLILGWGEVTAAALARRGIRRRRLVVLVVAATATLAASWLLEIGLAEAWRGWFAGTLGS